NLLGIGVRMDSLPRFEVQGSRFEGVQRREAKRWGDEIPHLKSEMWGIRLWGVRCQRLAAGSAGVWVMVCGVSASAAWAMRARLRCCSMESLACGGLWERMAR